jgi:hypothetical protein
VMAHKAFHFDVLFFDKEMQLKCKVQVPLSHIWPLK